MGKHSFRVFGLYNLISIKKMQASWLSAQDLDLEELTWNLHPHFPAVWPWIWVAPGAESWDKHSTVNGPSGKASSLKGWSFISQGNSGVCVEFILELSQLRKLTFCLFFNLPASYLSLVEGCFLGVNCLTAQLTLNGAPQAEGSRGLQCVALAPISNFIFERYRNTSMVFLNYINKI